MTGMIGRHRSMKTAWRARSLVILIATGLVAGGWWVAPRMVAVPAPLLEGQQVSPTFLSHDGRPLRQVLASDGQRVAQPLTLDQIPRSLIDATIAAEDRRFWSHGGVDWLAIARAGWSNFTSSRVVSGASTITMQLVKNASVTASRRTLAAKVREALQARHLEMMWSKEQILTAYLNRISYGNLFTGCATASWGYFNKPVGDLTVAECAFLAGLPQAPSKLNPFRDPAPALARQKRVLLQMRKQEKISEEQVQVAWNQRIRLDRFAGGFAAPHAVELIRRDPEQMPADGRGTGPGLIRTTIHFDLQRKVETIISQRLAGLESRHVNHAAAVVIENHSGHVVALAGSRDFFASDGGQINGAWTPHSPGSAVKPLTYLLAFEKGHTPATMVADLPIEFATPTGTYRPENYDRKLFGPMTYRDALGNSLNVSAVKVLQGIGGPAVLLARLRELGISTLQEDADHYGLGLTIGNAPVRLLELANAYACLARLGVWKPWSLLADQPPAAGRTVFGHAECYLIADILSDNQARVLCFGAHSPLRLPFPVAAKTGTSSTYRDNWTLGFTPEFTVGVWAGNFDNTPMENVSGVTGAAPIFRDIFIELHARHGTSWFKEPREIMHAKIDPRIGKRIGPQSPPPRMTREEIFVRGTEPRIAVAPDYETGTGRAILPAEFAKWAASRDNWLGNLVVCGDSTHGVPGPPRIVHPIPGTVVRLDPDIANHGNRLLLQAEAASEVDWSSPTLRLLSEQGSRFAILTPGRHEIVASLRNGRGSVKTWVIVEPE